eukprot:TRINITY_DN679_c0_g1_i1.p3 TRINITY_DN679_c0_g1~~TRINITY_DN679_c0_g1_i1.p3  ORF type:complete len:185 (+),score=17.45 TRINITY_DN679_c0_g1_i1:1097-1651(+)
MKLIKKGEVTFHSPIWKQVSPEAKNLILKMLIKSQENRITARQARMHPWIVKTCAKPVATKKTIALPLENLRLFHTQDTFQKAVLTFIASQLMDQDQEQSLRRLFSAFDVDDDGHISKEELMIGYRSLSLTKDMTEKEIENVMQHVDLNSNGIIDYNGTGQMNIIEQNSQQPTLKGSKLPQNKT